MKKLLISTILLSTPMWAQAIVMGSMRCGTDLVGVGDAMYEVKEKCGEPTSVEGDKWIYNRGPTEFLYIIEFGNGQVMSIDQKQQFD